MQPYPAILDEATSFLDSEYERRIQQAVERLHGNISVIVIAHRISTVRQADLVVLLNKGQITETGYWKGLMKRPHGRLRLMTEEHSGMLNWFETGACRAELFLVQTEVAGLT